MHFFGVPIKMLYLIMQNYAKLYNFICSFVHLFICLGLGSLEIYLAGGVSVVFSASLCCAETQGKWNPACVNISL